MAQEFQKISLRQPRSNGGAGVELLRQAHEFLLHRLEVGHVGNPALDHAGGLVVVLPALRPAHQLCGHPIYADIVSSTPPFVGIEGL